MSKAAFRQIAQTIDLSRPKELPLDGHQPGVYLLKRAGKVVYVGQSIDCRGRLAQHLRERSKSFDNAEYYPCEIHQLDIVESLLIDRLKPEYNFTPDNRTLMPLTKGKLLLFARELLAESGETAEQMSSTPELGAKPAPQRTHDPQKEEPAFMALPEVERVTSIKKSTIYKLVKAGEFPSPLQIGQRCSRWRRTDVQDWCSAGARMPD